MFVGQHVAICVSCPLETKYNRGLKVGIEISL